MRSDWMFFWKSSVFGVIGGCTPFNVYAIAIIASIVFFMFSARL